MTVRELVQKLIAEAPDLDASMYVSQDNWEGDVNVPFCYEIVEVTNHGNNDEVSIIIKSAN